MLSQLKLIKEGVLEVIFPHVCIVCGILLPKNDEFICFHCISTKFESANSEGKMVASDTFLPEGVDVQHSLWNFDKGGFLQDVLHSLKYHRLTGVGIDLGKALGNSFKKHPCYTQLKNPVLIPVPLHPKKKRKRGYNQAKLIAQGVHSCTNIPICSEDDVLRIKNTKTQTGFSIEKRRENIEKAFVIQNAAAIDNKYCIIVDDVFTTGATTFELADCLINKGAYKILIITVAQA